MLDVMAKKDHSALLGILPEGCTLSVTDPRLPREGMQPDRACVARAVPKRRYAFFAGRAAAREALADLGCYEATVPIGAQRAPVWPNGFTGSITHSDTLCLAVVAPKSDKITSIGIDAEPFVPLDRTLLEAVLSPAEIQKLMGTESDQLTVATQIFSIKEAVFKAVFPIAQVMFGFDAVAVTLMNGQFEATFTKSVGPFSEGDVVSGRYILAEGHVISVCALPHEGAAS